MTTSFQTIERIAQRSTSAILGLSRIASRPLRTHLLDTLPKTGAPAGLIAEPVIEAIHGWEAATETMEDLASTLLRRELIDALDGGNDPDPEDRERYRFRKDIRPYAHQLAAWRALLASEPRSVLISSGTGSGKTECFLVPLLETLLRENERHGRVSGVHAIMLYPLNALINSQRERLSDWTKPFRGDIRFCLYNGATEEEVREDTQRRHPAEVLSRKLLRANPPPILVTNITMLEYMLIRQEDHPILERSQAKLRYIILDEAHSYIGSKAAELSLLLRRVTCAFGVDPEEVRFVATSATIGGEGDQTTRDALGRFLADVAGVARDRVEVIEGRRAIPRLPDVVPNGKLPAASELEELNLDTLFDRLGRNPRFRRGFDALQSAPISLPMWCEALGADRAEGLAALGAAARAEKDGTRLLPIKVHAFQRPQSGLWACPNKACPGRRGTPLDGPEWSFGPVFHERIDRCHYCDASVFEVLLCSHCGTAFLDATRTPDKEGNETLTPKRQPPAEDEFLAELLDDLGNEDTEGDEEENGVGVAAGQDVLVLPADLGTGRDTAVELKGGRIHDSLDADTALLKLVPKAFECPNPECGVTFSRQTGARLWPLRAGAPFLIGTIVPELLDDTTPVHERAEGRGINAPLPAEGRQLLTFTDSRQGTARYAAKLQRDAERNHIRSLLYHQVQATQSVSPDVAARISQIRGIIEQQKQGGGPDTQVLIGALEAQLRTLSPASAIPWQRMTDIILGDAITRRWIKEGIWEHRSRALQDSGNFASFMLLREVIRRPRTANSIETMGLVRVEMPLIDNLIAVPSEFERLGGSLGDWKDFLHVATTMIFRKAAYAVSVNPDVLHWIAPQVKERHYLSRAMERRTEHQRHWPSAGTGTRRPLVVEYLSAGLQVSLDDPGIRDDVTAIMDAAWQALSPAMNEVADGRQLNPERLAFASVRAAYFCPVTRRVVDRVFRGLSPNAKGLRHFVEASPIRFPDFPFPFGRNHTQDATKGEIEEWLQSSPEVRQLRELGVWTDLHDRVVRRDVFYRSAEHSAQQPSEVLKEYEADFRNGRINVLNCSTTMEMGVDIGSIESVMMTNVPPSAASYRQRVGRAGRRGQAMSLAFTICKDRPLDRATFRAPARMINRTMSAPIVSLDSTVIVQRHVNALLLSRFLSNSDLLRMETGAFFGLNVDGTAAELGASPSERFLAWLVKEPIRSDARLSEDLEVLLRGTKLENAADAAVDAAYGAMDAIREAIKREWEALVDDLKGIGERAEAAKHAIQIQTRRLLQEFLLAELSGRGFLPAYGFPTNVVPFDNTTDHLPPRKRRAERDESRGRYFLHDVPSRSLDLAIRDYAPGSDIVVDGVVFRSSGVRLDWRRPVTDQSVREIQSLRFAWRCKRCGSTGTTANWPDACPSCGGTGADLQVHKFLKPSGFSCDPAAKPHSEIERVDFVPPKLPWVTARTGTWISFADPAVGRFRFSRDGMVFHHTLGAKGFGYAICLSCGRSAAEDGPLADPMPPAPQPLQGRHPPLRHGRNRSWCEVHSYTVQRHQALGYETSTDVFELQLSQIPRPEVALPIAAALRDALSRRLGIENDEMGVGTSQTRDGENADARWSVFVYDKAPGGAGFSVIAGSMLTELLRDASEILECPNGEACLTGCPDCILSRDLEMQGHLMARREARDFLKCSVLPRLIIPEPDRLFGEKTRTEMQPLADAVMREMDRTGAAELRVWLGPDTAAWDLDAWPLVPVIRKLALRGRRSKIVVPIADPHRLFEEVKVQLFGLVAKAGAELRAVQSQPKVGTGSVLAAVCEGAHCTAWASRARDASCPGVGWGAGGSPVVRSTGIFDYPVGEVVPADQLLKGIPDTALIEITRELDGPIGTFGARFWQVVKQKAQPIAALLENGGQLLEVEYADRYLTSPLPTRLAYEVIKAVPRASAQTQITIHTMEDVTFRSSIPSAFHHDWQGAVQRSRILAGTYARIPGRIVLHERPRAQLPHARTLILKFASGACRLILDQGFGFWRTSGYVRFDFTRTPEEQVRNLLASAPRVEASSTHGTWIVATPQA